MLFRLGTIMATPAAIRVCTKNNIEPMQLIQRHAAGDWGDISVKDADANTEAIQHDLRVFSAYAVGDGKVWCITEADRQSTCLLLPDDY